MRRGDDGKPRYDEEWCHEEVDYFLVQEGHDLASLSRDGSGRGYHWTTPGLAERILREGLGAPRRWLYDHEVGLAYCILDGNHVKIADRGGQSDEAVERALLRQYPNLHVIWFATDPEYEGETATGGGARIVIDLDGAGDWLGDLTKRGRTTTDEVWCFPDRATAPYSMGWGLFWNGPAIPPRFLHRDV